MEVYQMMLGDWGNQYEEMYAQDRVLAIVLFLFFSVILMMTIVNIFLSVVMDTYDELKTTDRKQKREKLKEGTDSDSDSEEQEEKADPRGKIAKRKAKEAKTKADQARKNANAAQSKADVAKKNAAEADKRAEQARKNAEDARLKAEQAIKSAEEARVKADEVQTIAKEVSIDINAKLAQEAAKGGSLRNASVVPTPPQKGANSGLDDLRSIRKQYGASSQEYQNAAQTSLEKKTVI